MQDTFEIVYLNGEDEKTAKHRVKVVPDYDYDPSEYIGGGMASLQFVEWRDQENFLKKLTYNTAEYANEVLRTGGIIFDGKQYWTEGPSDQDGQCYFAFDTRKIAKEYKQAAYDDMRLYFDRGAVAFVYETRCDSCQLWHSEDSLWGIVGWNKEMAKEFLLEHLPAHV